MKKLKKAVVVLLAFAMILSVCSISVFAAAEEGWSSSDLRLSVTARFVSGTFYHNDWDAGRITYRCYVTLKEGDYNSGRVYSKEGPKYYKPGEYISANKQKVNVPFVTSYANWGFDTIYAPY